VTAPIPMTERMNRRARGGRSSSNNSVYFGHPQPASLARARGGALAS
jgi:hypothetical protein